MPERNFSTNLFRANAAAATDWGAVEGSAESSFVAGASLKRGFKVEVGLSALAEFDAGFSKFIAAQLAGRASAEARVAAQLQLPLNLFEEAGVSVRVQAVAEAAAGVQVGLGLTLGDFVELARRIVGADGVPLKLLLLFLEEIELTIGAYAKVAATAQAQGYLSIVGTLRSDPTIGLKPGFNIVAGGGLGLAAGAGVRVRARAGFRDFPRFYARAVDLVVDEIFDEAAARLGNAAGPAALLALDVARPPIKTAFRLAYEIGEYISVQKPPQNVAGAAALAARTAAVVFEEGQRHILRGFVSAATKELGRLLGARRRALDAAGRARVKPRRDALVAILRGRPSDPFDTSLPSSQKFWIDVVESVVLLAVDLWVGASPPPDVRRALAAAWSAAQLLLVATKRANRSEAALSVGGLVVGQSHSPFKGVPAAQPPAAVSLELTAALGIARPSAGWGLEHAVAYLVSAGGRQLLDAAAPQLKPFLAAFRGAFGPTESAVAKVILENIGAVAPLGGGAPDPIRTLRTLLDALRLLVTDVVDAEAMPAARAALADSPEALLYLNDVLRPGLDFALGSCADLLLNWASGSVSASAATEALSGVVLKLLGRTLVVTGDVLQNYVQHETQGILERAATGMASTGLAARFASVSGLPADVAAARAGDFMRLVGRTMAPYTDAERREMRGLLFKVLDPLPHAAGRAFVDQLANDFFVTNAEAAARLVQRTFDLLSERFVAFALGALELLGGAFLDLLEDALRAAAAAVLGWIADAGRALAEAERRIAELGLEILAAADDAARLMNDALGELAGAFGAFGATSRRNALKNRLADALVDRAEDALDDNPIYRALPSGFRSDVADSARAIVRGLANSLVTPVFAAAAKAAEDVEDLLDDIRAIDATTGLASGIADVILDRVEAAVREALGGGDPGVDVAFGFSYSVPVVTVLPPSIGFKTKTVRINLGRVSLPISSLVTMLRQVVSATSGFETAVNRSVAKVRAWLEKELLAAAKAGEQSGLFEASAALRDDRAAVEGAPRDLVLAAPTHGAVYRDLLAVRVLLDGATAGFADFARGPRRFFAHLNGVELPNARFTVESRPSPSEAAGRVAIATHGVGGVTIPSVVARNAAASTSRALQGAASSFDRGRIAPSASWSATVVVAGRESQSPGSGLASSFKKPDRVHGVSASKPDRGGRDLFVGSKFRNSKTGARLREVDFNRVVESAPRATVAIRATLGLNEMVAGMNALSVTVVAADGSRLTRTATFVVEDPASKPPAAPAPGPSPLPLPLPLPGGLPRRPPLVLPPRLIATDPARLKPKPPVPPMNAAGRLALGASAVAAINAVKIDPSATLVAHSQTLKDRLAAAPPGRPPSAPSLISRPPVVRSSGAMPKKTAKKPKRPPAS